MSWDIYGNSLASGHCEVHPHVAQSWPCDLCRADDEQERYRRDVEERMYQKHMAEEQAASVPHVPTPTQGEQP